MAYHILSALGSSYPPNNLGPWVISYSFLKHHDSGAIYFTVSGVSDTADCVEIWNVELC
jgi:hypothetical protein